ncbi:MAG: ABC transporter substrate-binding protein [Bradyrhizobium sp.]
MKVGVFPVSSALPFFVAVERGYFAEQGIEPVATRMASGTLIIQSFLSGDLETAAALVTTEAFNVNLVTKNTILYLSINGQNEENRQETFVIRKGIDASSIKDLKGKAAKIMSASGPANVAFAKAVLKANGMEEGKDYSMTDLPVNLHVSAMTAGTFDAGYTLEPAGTMLKANGGATELEGGGRRNLHSGPQGRAGVCGGLSGHDQIRQREAGRCTPLRHCDAQGDRDDQQGSKRSRVPQGQYVGTAGIGHASRGAEVRDGRSGHRTEQSGFPEIHGLRDRTGRRQRANRRHTISGDARQVGILTT